MRFEFHEVSEEPPIIVQTMVEIPTFSLGLSDFQPSASPRESIAIQSPTTAYEIAQAYMQEIAASPFSFEESPIASPRLETTSKPTEIEDNLFDDEPGSAVSLAPPVSQQSVLQHSERSIETQTSFSFSCGRGRRKPGAHNKACKKCCRVIESSQRNPLRRLIVATAPRPHCGLLDHVDRSLS